MGPKTKVPRLFRWEFPNIRESNIIDFRTGGFSLSVQQQKGLRPIYRTSPLALAKQVKLAHQTLESLSGKVRQCQSTSTIVLSTHQGIKTLKLFQKEKTRKIKKLKVLSWAWSLSAKRDSPIPLLSNPASCSLHVEHWSRKSLGTRSFRSSTPYSQQNC